MSNPTLLADALSILRDFIHTVESVGVHRVKNELEWLDLHNLYQEACELLEVTPEEPEDPYSDASLDAYEDELRRQFGDDDED